MRLGDSHQVFRSVGMVLPRLFGVSVPPGSFRREGVGTSERVLVSVRVAKVVVQVLLASRPHRALPARIHRSNLRRNSLWRGLSWPEEARSALLPGFDVDVARGLSTVADSRPGLNGTAPGDRDALCERRMRNRMLFVFLDHDLRHAPSLETDFEFHQKVEVYEFQRNGAHVEVRALNHRLSVDVQDFWGHPTTLVAHPTACRPAAAHLVLRTIVVSWGGADRIGSRILVGSSIRIPSSTMVGCPVWIGRPVWIGHPIRVPSSVRIRSSVGVPIVVLRGKPRRKRHLLVGTVQALGRAEQSGYCALLTISAGTNRSDDLVKERAVSLRSMEIVDPILRNIVVIFSLEQSHVLSELAPLDGLDLGGVEEHFALVLQLLD
uniref:Uncharacterized protein n=1 Tax=Strombidium inclinatum TaxID=197538 RepID=A0A7S3MTE8_9SPIT|mmetsp:Transcript_13647/g.21366  ORF Transcript_13647/g.21366 Transcript_13647/m.21366 type:complete len:378 (+) Transcript_13647:249-1382(+)